jgi:hypothetical protein
LANDWTFLDFYCFLFTLCDIRHHGNAEVSSTLYVSTPKAKEQYKKTQNVLKSHNVVLKNDPLFLNFISSLSLVFFNDIKFYECSKLRFTLTI